MIFLDILGVFFLKNKDHVFENFKEFKVFVEKQCDRDVEYLRSDNGVEYVSKAFESYLSQIGIS
jgi:hypothetical protein